MLKLWHLAGVAGATFFTELKLPAMSSLFLGCEKPDSDFSHTPGIFELLIPHRSLFFFLRPWMLHLSGSKIPTLRIYCFTAKALIGNLPEEMRDRPLRKRPVNRAYKCSQSMRCRETNAG